MYLGIPIFKILYIQQSLLNHPRDLSDSRPNSSKCFSCEVPLIEPVIARACLYWKDSVFWEKVALLGWSYRIPP